MFCCHFGYTSFLCAWLQEGQFQTCKLGKSYDPHISFFNFFNFLNGEFYFFSIYFY